MELNYGRPKDLSVREQREIMVYDFLDNLGVEYEYVDHGPVMTMEDCVDVDKILDAMMCKNIFLSNATNTEYFLLLLPGDKKFKSKEVSKQAGSTRLSFAAPEAMEEFLDIHPGAVSVMGLMNDKAQRVQLLVDERLMESKMFACHPCVNTTSIRFKTKDLFEKILPATGHEPKILSIQDC